MTPLTLPPLSVGIGDRFAHQGQAQLAAFLQAKRAGVNITPVWNKSNREHQIIGTHPSSVRAEADAAVQSLHWTDPYHVDADHVSLKTVDPFLPASDFYTLDVADFVSHPASPDSTRAFLSQASRYLGPLTLPNLSLEITPAHLQSVADKYLLAIQQAGQIYRHIASSKSPGSFITEISIDETDQPQSPIDLLFILYAISLEKIPLQTIAPKFTGRFNKGVDYVGSLPQFEKEFNDDLSILSYSISEFGLPANLKLSVHSGSDKFSLYPIIRSALRRHHAGLHIKTAGTTWLEELIGLAEAGGDALSLAKHCYLQSLSHCDDLCAPYATVINIDQSQLPPAHEVQSWTCQDFTSALCHDPANPHYNPHLRQLLHVGYKVAAQLGTTYTDALKSNQSIIAQNVTQNLYNRHIQPLFLD